MPLKLSEAIRLGSMMKPQAFGALIRSTWKGKVFGDVLGLRWPVDTTCAIGAAFDAVGGLNCEATTQALPAMFPGAATMLAVGNPCPSCGLSVAETSSNTIAHLNNDHRWTRERIADWVETIENAQSVKDGTYVVAASTQDEPQTRHVRAK